MGVPRMRVFSGMTFRAVPPSHAGTVRTAGCSPHSAPVYVMTARCVATAPPVAPASPVQSGTLAFAAWLSHGTRSSQRRVKRALRAHTIPSAASCSDLVSLCLCFQRCQHDTRTFIHTLANCCPHNIVFASVASVLCANGTAAVFMLLLVCTAPLDDSTPWSSSPTRAWHAYLVPPTTSPTSPASPMRCCVSAVQHTKPPHPAPSCAALGSSPQWL